MRPHGDRHSSLNGLWVRVNECGVHCGVGHTEMAVYLSQYNDPLLYTVK